MGYVMGISFGPKHATPQRNNDDGSFGKRGDLRQEALQRNADSMHQSSMFKAVRLLKNKNPCEGCFLKAIQKE
jgi:hypothetical protein